MKQNIQQLQKLLGLYIQTKKDGSDTLVLSNLRLRILDLVKVLSQVNMSYIRKTVAFALMVIGINTVQAQTFAPVQINPFNLVPGTVFNVPTLVDLDNDGDLDIMNSGYNTSPIQYFENKGSTTNPAYGAAQNDPFGLSMPVNTYLFRMSFADMDADGDMDMIASSDDYNSNTFRYYENIGTASAPNFAAAVFGLGGSIPIPLATYNSLTATSLGDLDGDGDIDILLATYDLYGANKLSYYENTGTATNTIFGTSVDAPFNMGAGLIYYAIPELTDIDGDGDLDIMFSHYNTYGDISLYANIGTAQTPNFGPRMDNPFNLTPVDKIALITSGDIDNDGDMDLIVGEMYDTAYISNFNYFENISPISSVEELDLSDASLYPSPAQDIVNLDLTFVPETIIFTDALGRVVKTLNTLNNLNYIIDVSDLENGIYTIVISKENQRGTKRFIKNK